MCSFVVPCPVEGNLFHGPAHVTGPGRQRFRPRPNPPHVSPPPRSLCGRTNPVRWRASFHMFLQLCTACSSVSQTHTTHLQTSFCLSLSVGHITTIGRRPGPQRMVPQRKVVHHALGAVSTPLARAAFGVTGPLPAHLSPARPELVFAPRSQSPRRLRTASIRRALAHGTT